MITKSNLRSVFGEMAKFLNEVCCALFVSTDKRDYQRWKDFFAA
ncbi:MAG: hypothetical protein WKI04_10655 [Ferruginibacter sp.]